MILQLYSGSWTTLCVTIVGRDSILQVLSSTATLDRKKMNPGKRQDPLPASRRRVPPNAACPCLMIFYDAISVLGTWEHDMGIFLEAPAAVRPYLAGV